MKQTWLGLLLVLGGCAYSNPNVYTYGWRPPAPPAPNSRSFMGYDPAYEQQLIDQYVASHSLQVQIFRSQNGLDK
jgi:hypothetical protein